MKLIKLIGLLCLFCITFFYTEKVITVTMNQDEIMIKIKEYAEEHNYKPTNAIIKDDTIIPGSIGKEVNEETSYKAMKRISYFDPSLITYNDVYPEISIYNNLNKFIIKGNIKNQNISLLYILSNNNTLDNLLNIINKYDTKINFFIDENYLNNNINIIDKIKNHEIYNYGNMGTYTKDNLIIGNNIINNKSNNKAIFCLFTNKDNLGKEKCANNKMLSIIVNKNDNYYALKNDLYSGRIFLINNTKELPNVIEYILSKGYHIVSLSELIKE